MNARKDPRELAVHSSIHDAIRVDTNAAPAVVFNDLASTETFLSYAHGQMALLRRILPSIGDEELQGALVAVLDPAMTAVDIACARVRAGNMNPEQYREIARAPIVAADTAKAAPEGGAA
jgi:hypothetical protein